MSNDVVVPVAKGDRVYHIQHPHDPSISLCAGFGRMTRGVVIDQNAVELAIINIELRSGRLYVGDSTLDGDLCRGCESNIKGALCRLVEAGL